MKIKSYISRIFIILVLFELALQIELQIKTFYLKQNISQRTSTKLHFWGGSIFFFASPNILDNLQLSSKDINQSYKGSFTTEDAINLAIQLPFKDKTETIILMTGLHDTKKYSLDNLQNKFSYLTQKTIKKLLFDNNDSEIRTTHELKIRFTYLIKSFISSTDWKYIFRIVYLKNNFSELDAAKIYSEALSENIEFNSFFENFNFSNIKANDIKKINHYLGLISHDNLQREQNRSFSLIYRYFLYGSMNETPSILMNINNLMRDTTKYCKNDNCKEFHKKYHKSHSIYDIAAASIIYSVLRKKSLIPKETRNDIFPLFILFIKMINDIHNNLPQKQYENKADSFVNTVIQVDTSSIYDYIYKIKDFTMIKENFAHNIKYLKSILKQKNYKLVLLHYPGHNFKFITEIANKNNIPIILNPEHFTEEINQNGFFSYFIDNLVYRSGHLNKKGRQIWSKSIANSIKRHLP